jgi:hypothetical protein
MDAEQKSARSKNLAVSVDPKTYESICLLSEKLGTSKRSIVRDAVRCMAIIQKPRKETRTISCCCSHGTDGQHDE